MSPTPAANPLELIPQAELNVAALVSLRRDAPEVGVARIARGDVVPVRVVDEVEDLGPELDFVAATDTEVLEERDIPILFARVVCQVARAVAEGPRRRRLERRWIDPVVR